MTQSKKRWEEIGAHQGEQIKPKNPIASYFMQGLLFPKSICSCLEKAIRDFFWNDKDKVKKLHLISWGKICSSKSQGGLNIPRFHARNIAFFAKLVWTAKLSSSDFWAFICNHRLSLKSGTTGSLLGRGLALGDLIVSKGSYKILKSGANSLFWFDVWCPLGPIRGLIQGPLLAHEFSVC